MRQIIYMSSCHYEMTSACLEEIAAQARKNNPREQITGLLLYGDQLFFQVLEGPDAQIESMRQRIWTDPRHKGINEVKNAAIESRSFPDWSMGCYRVDACTETIDHWTIVDVNSIKKHIPDSVSPDVLVLARTFFQSIARR